MKESAHDVMHRKSGDPVPRSERKQPPVRPVVLEHVPQSEEERKLLRAACKAIARKAGKTGKQLTIETERIYQASVVEAGRIVKTVLPKLIVPARSIFAPERGAGLIVSPHERR